MFIVTINGIDSSAHTFLNDAEAQKSRFENLGESNVTIEEKETFNPPQDN